MLVKFKQSLLRFDYKATPPAQIKPVGHVIGDGVTRADVHVTPRLLPTERSREVVIFKALCVREFHCALGSDECSTVVRQSRGDWISEYGPTNHSEFFVTPEQGRRTFDDCGKSCRPLHF